MFQAIRQLIRCEKALMPDTRNTFIKYVALSVHEVHMESASVFAKKHGLEQYLEKPDALNEMIIKLLVLQEAMQAEAERKMQTEGAGRKIISIRRTAGGKFTVRCSGDGTYRYAVETALKGSTALVPLFQWGRFVSLLRKMGVPEDRSSEYCSSVTLHDDTICIDQE